MKKAYTGTGDDGYTTDFAGNHIPKDDIKIIVGVKIDALQLAIDISMLRGNKEYLKILEWIQTKLWQTAGEVGNVGEECLIEPVTDQDIKKLEEHINTLGELPQKFIRFNTESSIIYNECRIRCRELETFLVKVLRTGNLRPIAYKWINRLSSFFYMMSYKASQDSSI